MPLKPLENSLALPDRIDESGLIVGWSLSVMPPVAVTPPIVSGRVSTSAESTTASSVVA